MAEIEETTPDELAMALRLMKFVNEVADMISKSEFGGSSYLIAALLGSLAGSFAAGSAEPRTFQRTVVTIMERALQELNRRG